MTAGGLLDFEDLSNHIIALSPHDGSELPTVSAYPWAYGETKLSESRFQKLLRKKITHIRAHIAGKRNAQ